MGKEVLHVIPLLVLNSNVPPLPVTLPMAIDPLVSMHPEQVLLTIANEPEGGEGGIHTPGLVLPTNVGRLLQPLVPNTLAIMLMGKD